MYTYCFDVYVYVSPFYVYLFPILFSLIQKSYIIVLSHGSYERVYHII